jgi:CheY-like chemotaxis protein
MTRPLLLLVDDAPEMGLIVRALARRGGCDVACRGDVAAAWAYLQENRPDLVLLDVQLPGDNGLTLCRRVRATPALADQPIALFTHWGLPGDIAAGLEAGVDFVFSKDLVGRPAEWQRRLEDILSRAHGRGRGCSLGWKAEAGFPPPVPNWIQELNRALDHPSLRSVGPEVMRILLSRAVAAGGSELSAEQRARWLAPGGTSLRDEGPTTAAAVAVGGLVASLVDQLGCLLGTEAVAAWAEALEAVAPGISQILPRR